MAEDNKVTAQQEAALNQKLQQEAQLIAKVAEDRAIQELLAQTDHEEITLELLEETKLQKQQEIIANVTRNYANTNSNTRKDVLDNAFSVLNAESNQNPPLNEAAVAEAPMPNGLDAFAAPVNMPKPAIAQQAAQAEETTFLELPQNVFAPLVSKQPATKSKPADVVETPMPNGLDAFAMPAPTVASTPNDSIENDEADTYAKANAPKDAVIPDNPFATPPAAKDALVKLAGKVETLDNEGLEALTNAMLKSGAISDEIPGVGNLNGIITDAQKRTHVKNALHALIAGNATQPIDINDTITTGEEQVAASATRKTQREALASVNAVEGKLDGLDSESLSALLSHLAKTNNLSAEMPENPALATLDDAQKKEEIRKGIENLAASNDFAAMADMLKTTDRETRLTANRAQEQHLLAKVDTLPAEQLVEMAKSLGSLPEASDDVRNSLDVTDISNMKEAVKGAIKTLNPTSPEAVVTIIATAETSARKAEENTRFFTEQERMNKLDTAGLNDVPSIEATRPKSEVVDTVEIARRAAQKAGIIGTLGGFASTAKNAAALQVEQNHSAALVKALAAANAEKATLARQLTQQTNTAELLNEAMNAPVILAPQIAANPTNTPVIPVSLPTIPTPTVTLPGDSPTPAPPPAAPTRDASGNPLASPQSPAPVAPVQQPKNLLDVMNASGHAAETKGIQYIHNIKVGEGVDATGKRVALLQSQIDANSQAAIAAGVKQGDMHLQNAHLSGAHLQANANSNVFIHIREAVTNHSLTGTDRTINTSGGKLVVMMTEKELAKEDTSISVKNGKTNITLKGHTLHSDSKVDIVLVDDKGKMLKQMSAEKMAKEFAAEKARPALRYTAEEATTPTAPATRALPPVPAPASGRTAG